MSERTTNVRARTVLLLLIGVPAVAAAIALYLTGSSRRGAASADVPPLVIVGVDGLEWELVLRFGADGDLPNLMALAREGYAAKLDTLDETISPSIWTTIATGKRPEKHGITGFWYEEPDGTKRLFQSVHRRSKTLWNLFGDRADEDLTTAVHGWWCTFPVEEIRGEMVAQTSTRAQIEIQAGQIWKGSFLEGLPKQVWPEELEPGIVARSRDLVERTKAEMQATFGYPAPSSFTTFTEGLWNAIAMSLYADVLFRDVALDALREKRPHDALLVYFGVTDVASHMFWRHFEPEKFDHPPPAAEVADFKDVIRGAYRWVDAAIGEIRKLAPDADLLVISDHGFHAVNVHVDFGADATRKDSGHHMNAPPGVLIASGRSFRHSPLREGATLSDLRSVGRVEDVLPTLLARHGIPYGEDMDGRPLRNLLDEALLRERPIASVESHEDAAWREQRAAALAEFPNFLRKYDALMRDLEAKQVERLKQVGYVGSSPPPEPPPK